MTRYKLHILAIQKYTPWNRELSDGEVKSIHKHCESLGYFATVTKLQILITDKQMWASHRDSRHLEDGRIIHSRYEVSSSQHASFISLYGVPHHGGEKTQYSSRDVEESITLQKMIAVKNQLKSIIREAKRNNDIIFVFGDLQDVPDNSSNFRYGQCKIPKHPLGIVKTCEDLQLACSIYKFLHTLDTPIISRHGSKGGRFIDGMFVCNQGLNKITGVNIVLDSGINSDHDLVISKIDLGMEDFVISKEKEEQKAFKQIMNIPMHIQAGHQHPTLMKQYIKDQTSGSMPNHIRTYKKLQMTPTMTSRKE